MKGRKQPVHATSAPAPKTQLNYDFEAAAGEYLTRLTDLDKSVETILRQIKASVDVIRKANPQYRNPIEHSRIFRELGRDTKANALLYAELERVKQDGRQASHDILHRAEVSCVRYQAEYLPKLKQIAQELHVKASPTLSDSSKRSVVSSPKITKAASGFFAAPLVAVDPFDELRKCILKLNVYRVIDELRGFSGKTNERAVLLIPQLLNVVEDSLNRKKTFPQMSSQLNAVLDREITQLSSTSSRISDDYASSIRWLSKNAVRHGETLKVGAPDVELSAGEQVNLDRAIDLTTYYLAKSFPTRGSKGDKNENNVARMNAIVAGVRACRSPEQLKVMLEQIEFILMPQIRENAQAAKNIELLKADITKIFPQFIASSGYKY